MASPNHNPKLPILSISYRSRFPPYRTRPAFRLAVPLSASPSRFPPRPAFRLAWRVLGWEVPVKVIVAAVEGYKERFTLVTSAVELTGLQMVELFTARFRQEDGFRDLKQRLGWEECRAWTANPIQRTSQVQWVTMSLLRLLQFRLEACGEVGWWFRPPWNKKKDRPSVLDAERLMRRHREQIQRLLSKWARNEGNTEEHAA